MVLTDTAIRKAKPAEKEWKLADERGLYLLVTPTGSKLWRLKYRYNGQEKKLALGAYPDIGLQNARAKREEARKLLAGDVDPGGAKKDAQIAKRISVANTFAAVAAEYIDKMEQEGKAPATLAKVRWILALLTPAIGSRPIAEIQPHELLEILRKIERTGKRETASRMTGGFRDEERTSGKRPNCGYSKCGRPTARADVDRRVANASVVPPIE